MLGESKPSEAMALGVEYLPSFDREMGIIIYSCLHHHHFMLCPIENLLLSSLFVEDIRSSACYQAKSLSTSHSVCLAKHRGLWGRGLRIV